MHVDVAQHLVLVGHLSPEVLVLVPDVLDYAGYLVEVLVLVLEHLLLDLEHLPVVLAPGVVVLSVLPLDEWPGLEVVRAHASSVAVSV